MTTADSRGDEDIHGDRQQTRRPPPPSGEAPEGPKNREAESLRKDIAKVYGEVTYGLRRKPADQEECFSLLVDAEARLSEQHVHQIDIIHARWLLARARAVVVRERTSNLSVMAVVLVVYLVVGAIAAGAAADVFEGNVRADALNRKLVMGIPQPVLVWAVIGSLASMLLRVGSTNFDNPIEALRWVLTRPFVGTVMGVLVYLMVVAGLIVFAGDPQTQTPELIWVLAFAGGFSDQLSVSLLGRFSGSLENVKRSDAVREPGASPPESGQIDPTPPPPKNG